MRLLGLFFVWDPITNSELRSSTPKQNEKEFTSTSTHKHDPEHKHNLTHRSSVTKTPLKRHPQREESGSSSSSKWRLASSKSTEGEPFIVSLLFLFLFSKLLCKVHFTRSVSTSLITALVLWPRMNMADFGFSTILASRFSMALLALLVLGFLCKQSKP